jgi:ATP-dependent protease ClpP protease subunit
VVADDDLWVYDWFGISAFSPHVVREAIRDNVDDELVVEVNSGGGSVFAGFEIFSLLRGAECRTVAVVQSLAASAASTIISGCDTVQVSPVAQIMLHLPAIVTEGNREDHRDSIKLLDSITESILNGYESKCRGKATRDKLAQLMRAETWIPAQDAVEMGLADEILYQDDTTSIIPGNIVNAVGSSIRGLINGATQPSAAELRARYADLVAKGATPAAGHPAPAPIQSMPWQARARLEIEKNRY